jgi:hypothetical protein
LTFDLLTSKSIAVICQWWLTSLSTFMILGQSVHKLSSGNEKVIDRVTDICETIVLLE